MSAHPPYDTPILDQLESGPWPSFVTGLKRLARDNAMMVDLMGQLETSYQARKDLWQGGAPGESGRAFLRISGRYYPHHYPNG